VVVTFTCSSLIAEKKYSLRMSFYESTEVFDVSAIKRTVSLEHSLQVTTTTNEKILSNPTTIMSKNNNKIPKYFGTLSM
jgi:hypothetical protein